MGRALRGILLAGVVFAGAPAVPALRAAHTAPPDEPADIAATRDCRALLGKRFGQAVVLGATQVFPPHVVTQGPTSIPLKTPFCLVEARAQAERGSEVGFEVWLPSHGKWNERLLAIGSGGSFGQVYLIGLARGVLRGFATVSSDDGHQQQRSSNNTWAFGHPARVRDFGGRGQHLANVAAKGIVAAYYGRRAKYAYFYGYSRGAATALAIAQRYPAEFDGILAGAPPYSWAKEMVMQAWILKALTRTPASSLSGAEMEALGAAVHRACAGPDALIADPRECAFDPASLRCPVANDGFCLREEQIAAVRDIWRGPHDSKGVRITRGLTRGSEGSWRRLWDVQSLGVDAAGGSWLGVFRYLVFDDPTWTLDRIDFDRDPDFAERKLATILTQDDPDLRPFARHGGKLIVYHGWSDDMAPAEPSVDYHAAVTAELGREATDAVMRLYMLPGVDHRRSGPGAGIVLQTEATPAVPATPGRDMLATLQHWVEDGVAPGPFVATQLDAQGQVTRTRLLCPEPQRARYAGSGDALDAATWTCAGR